MSNWKIENTLESDLDRACELYHDAIAFQKSKGFPLYVCDARDSQLASIKKGLHFKLMYNNAMVGMFNFQYKDEKIWGERDTGESIYIHGVLVDSKMKGQNAFDYILKWTIDYLKSKKIYSLRLDTWADNPSLENYYKSYGFKVVDHFHIPDEDGLPLNCRGNKVVLMEYLIER